MKVAVLIGALSLACLVAQPLEAQFLPHFDRPGLDGTVKALAVWDDGSGPALYAGGRFNRADGNEAFAIAAWDGARWSALGSGLQDPSAFYQGVNALAVFDDGGGPALFAAGQFREAGGQPASNVAKWDGRSWTPLPAVAGSPVVLALAVFDDGTGPALYAGTSSSLLSWDGSAWTTHFGFGGGTTSIRALEVYDDGAGAKLFIGGEFSQLVGVTVNHIASWDGASIEPLAAPSGAAGVDGEVDALEVYDPGGGPRLYVGGHFDAVVGLPAQDVASWNGTRWGIPDGPPGFGVLAMAVHDDGGGPRLHVGSRPRFPNNIPSHTVAAWDGSDWTSLSTPGALGDLVLAFASYDEGDGPALFAGGQFSQNNESSTERVARWDGTAWTGVSVGGFFGMNQATQALETLDLGDGPKLYAGGLFWLAGDTVSVSVAAFDGQGWSRFHDPSGQGLGSLGTVEVRALAAFDSGAGPRLIAGGDFFRDSEPPLDNLTAWDGVEWSPLLPEGVTFLSGQEVNALRVFDDGTGPALYFAGNFPTLGGQPVGHIALWDGAAWSALFGSLDIGVNRRVFALEVFDDGTGPALYVGGGFLFAGGVSRRYLARWDGSSWSTVGDVQLSGTVTELEVFDDGTGPALYVGGFFEKAGDETVNRLVKWDGTSFTPLVGPQGVGVDGIEGGGVSALRVVDASDGARLYVGGSFTRAGGRPARQLASWDGQRFQPVIGDSALGFKNGFNSDAPALALAAFDPGDGPSLFAGGDFVRIYGTRSYGVGQYRARPEIFADGFESGDVSAWAPVP